MTCSCSATAVQVLISFISQLGASVRLNFLGKEQNERTLSLSEAPAATQRGRIAPPVEVSFEDPRLQPAMYEHQIAPRHLTAELQLQVVKGFIALCYDLSWQAAGRQD